MGKQILNTTLKKKLQKHKPQIVCKLHKYNNKEILSKKCLCTTIIGVSRNLSLCEHIQCDFLKAVFLHNMWTQSNLWLGIYD